MRRWLFLASPMLLLVLLGPRTSLDERWVEPELGDDVQAYLERAEHGIPDLREEARKSVVWLDPETRARTPLAVVYLHGFSADRHEVDPLVHRVAQRLAANAFFTRLAGHGRSAAAMGEVSAEDWLDDAAEALAIGRTIGERVVLMGTSTGGTLATWVASRPEARADLAALVLMSPNYGPRDPASQLLLWPWGGAIARAFQGAERCFEPVNAEQAQHWTECYPTRALLPMMALTERAWTLDGDLVTTPVLTLYSDQDLVVDPDRIVARHGRFESVRSRLVPVSVSPTGAYHVLAGDILSPETTDVVAGHVVDFVESAMAAGR